jgi:asparagine synthase (glutamine-hydrolysing)
MREAFKGRTSGEAVAEIRKRYDAGAKERSPLSWMSYVDLNLRLPELLLMRVDKMSMGASLECRVPFLDHKFVQLALGIPTAAKTRNGTLKHILKKAVAGLIPDEIIHRPKQGFGVPIHEWFFDRLGPAMRREILRFCDATDVLDREGVEELFRQNDGVRLWWLFNLAAWHSHFIAGEDVSVQP